MVNLKKYLIIRDDDLSYWTKVDEIENVYKYLFERKIKVSFAVIPFAVKMYNAGNFEKFYQDENSATPIDKNKKIVEYVKEKIKEGLVEIMLHGYNHLYRFECDGRIQIASKKNLYNARKSGKNIKFIGEYNYGNYDDLYKKTKEGKEYLEDIFKIKIYNFVPPSNQINKNGVKAIIDNNLNLSGLIGKIYNRENTLKGYFTYIDRIIFYLKNRNIIYPKIANYGKHSELVGYAITPSTNWQKLYNQLEYCAIHNYPFQIATHYWELKGELKNKFYNVIDLILTKNYKSKFLKEVIS
jgi:predicted deacetylase